MPNGKTRRHALASPIELKPLAKKGELLRVVIETPKGSRNKYAFNPDERVFELKRVLPAGMEFPYDFGFLPRTKGGDGDPVDVLVLMDEPAFTGCVVKCRLIGVILGEQQEQDGTRERNDRLLAVEDGNHVYAHVKHISDLPKILLKELEEFFVNYHCLQGSKYKLLGCKGPEVGHKLIAKSMRAA